jgi:HlyD family secretion protein
MTRYIVAGGLAVVLVVFSVLEVHGRARAAGPLVRSEAATFGELVRTVEAEGTLKARETVVVGSQVSGTISEIDVDFNSVVHRGQVLARLDPSLVKEEIEQARGALAQAQADVEQARITLDDAKYKFDQARALRAKDDIAQSDFDVAETAYKLADADLRSKQAQVTQARSVLDQSEVDLRNTVIESPVDGVVVGRDVEVGQTVASRLQAPSLFEIATDLAHMQAVANVDEADIGQVAAGQAVRFTVGAYPGDQFPGVVNQVRLDPDTSEGGVEYSVVIDVDNSALKLRPGMTPTVSIEVERREGVLQVPVSALRFVPAPELFAQLNDRPPANLDALARAEKHLVEGGRGYVWVADGRLLTPVPVTVGMSDGTRTEVSSPSLRPGTAVVTGVLVKP